MKILSISTVWLIGALMLALVVAWDCTAPQLITGHELGGWPDCSTTTHPFCTSKPEETCAIRREKCDSSGNLKCFVAGTIATRPCRNRTDCVDQSSESCN